MNIKRRSALLMLLVACLTAASAQTEYGLRLWKQGHFATMTGVDSITFVANVNDVEALDTAEWEKYKGLRVLWIGTSIPAGCQYPKVACEKWGLRCQNNSVGAQHVCFIYGKDWPGSALSSTAKEIDDMYKDKVSSGEMTQQDIDVLKFSAYENRIMQYVRDADVMVFDHGYNDGDLLIAQYDSLFGHPVDWTSKDRGNFIGAFNYLYSRCMEANPSLKVILGGYFEDQGTIGTSIRGGYVRRYLEKIAAHYHLPLLDVWNYTYIPDGFVPGSANYLDSLNQTYGTNFQPTYRDEEGNITWFQRFCPDGVHPFTDPTGTSESELNRVVTYLLPRRIMECYKEKGR